MVYWVLMGSVNGSANVAFGFVPWPDLGQMLARRSSAPESARLARPWPDHGPDDNQPWLELGQETPACPSDYSSRASEYFRTKQNLYGRQSTFVSRGPSRLYLALVPPLPLQVTSIRCMLCSKLVLWILLPTARGLVARFKNGECVNECQVESAITKQYAEHVMQCQWCYICTIACNMLP